MDDLIAGLKWLGEFWAFGVGGVAALVAWYRYGKRHSSRVMRAVVLSDRLHDRYGRTEPEQVAADIHGGHVDAAVREVRVVLLERKVSAAIYVCDALNGDCTYANSELAELWGMDAADLSGTGWLSAIDTTERNRVWREWQESIKNHIPYECTYKVTNQRTGESFRCHTKAYPAKVKSGQTVWYVGSVERIEE